MLFVQKEWRVFSGPLHREPKRGTLITILKQARIDGGRPSGDGL